MNSKTETMNDLPIHKAGRERLSHIKGFEGGLLSSEQPKSLYSECTEILDNFEHILICSDKFSRNKNLNVVLQNTLKYMNLKRLTPSPPPKKIVFDLPPFSEAAVKFIF